MGVRWLTQKSIVAVSKSVKQKEMIVIDIISMLLCMMKQMTIGASDLLL